MSARYRTPFVSDSNMTTYQLPPPTFPSRMEFVSDANPGFSEPYRYDSNSHSRRPHDYRSTCDEQPRRTFHEPLPSVRQLLTPGSQSSISTSPFSPQLSPDLSEVSPAHQSAGRNTLSERSTQPGRYSYHHSYDALPPQPLVRESVIDHRTKDYHAIALASHHQTSHPNSLQSNSQQYTSYPDPIHLNTQSNQPRPIAPLSSPNTYYSQAPAYESSRSPLSDRGSSGRDTATIVKPSARVVGERTIPGEGPCWVYEDGSTCKKVIDGETVNAQWGVTKAGKPRKRLAIACTTCREKKIKCDPGDPKCVQCEKYLRVCRFTTAYRDQHISPESPSYDDQARITLKNPRNNPRPTLAEKFKVSLVTDYKKGPASDRGVFSEDQSTSNVRSVLKRRRPDSAQITTSKQGDAKSMPPEPERPIASDQAAPAPWEAVSYVRPFNWGSNPYMVDPDVTMHYMETYFSHINAATYRIFPRKHFLHWVKSETAKSSNDLMLIYTMLTMGTVFSSRSERNHEGPQFSKIAVYAVGKNHGNYSLQLVQSRLLLAFYHFSIGDTAKAWDYGGMGFRVASGLKLNLEEGVTDITEDEMMEYGMNRHALAECRRRTYWSAYMMDRFSGFCSARLCAIHDEDTFIRLPCDEDIYENQEPVTTPYFDNELTDQRLCQNNVPSKLGPMAYYAQVSAIWGDVLANIYRSPHQSIERYSLDHEAFHITTHQRLESWKASLPEYLSYSTPNTRASIDNGYVGTFISLHTIYHATAMKLDHVIRHAHLPASSVSRAIQEATHHALQLLDMMQTLSSAESQKVSTSTPSQPSQKQLRIPFSTPFAGYAILVAIGILSAGGSLEPAALTKRLRIMRGGLKVTEELGQFWASARAQRRVIRKRIEQLAECATSDEAAGKKVWIMRSPLDKTFGGHQDAFYNETVQQPAGRTKFLESLGLSDTRDHEILMLGGESRDGGWWE